MKHIIVIAGNKTQFDDYVMGCYIDKINYQSHGRITVFEGVTFLWVNDVHQLQGYLLSSDAELIKVGSWYNLRADIVQSIEEQFKARKMVMKA